MASMRSFSSLSSGAHMHHTYSPEPTEGCAYGVPVFEGDSFPPRVGASFAELRAFCNEARNHNEREMFDYNTTYDSANTTYCDSGFTTEPQYGDEFMDDDGADWFDEEFLGLERPNWKFDYPVPMEPILPVECLRLVSFADGHRFYVDDDGYVQVFTEGECRDRFSKKASIAVWFGPDHPKNVSERLYRGRRTQEAARFAAVIEAIRVAGSCGVTRLQINTAYVNIVRFMLYFILKWEHNGWKTILNQPVKNQVLIRELDYYSNLVDIKWNYVPIEEKVFGIEEANRLAQEALDLVYETHHTVNTFEPNPSAAASTSVWTA